MIQGEVCDLAGDRCFSAHYEPSRHGINTLPLNQVSALYDSGAFQRVRDSFRISHEECLRLQLYRERQLSEACGQKWEAYAISSNDVLIDEKWVNGQKVKSRWSEDEAWAAVDQTVDAVKYLVAQRPYLSDRKLVLGCQGVTAAQYKICVERVLEIAEGCPDTWIGLGGWCILGLAKFRHWLPEFEETLNLTIPLIAQSSIRHIHLFGVLWEPAIAPFQYICDQYGLSCSTDSKKPLSDCRWKTAEQRKSAGARAYYWRDNVAYWQDFTTNIAKRSRFYRMPRKIQGDQLSLW